MMRIAHCLTLAAGFAVSAASVALLATPAAAATYTLFNWPHHASHGYRHYAAHDLFNPAFRGPFGRYADAKAASHYSGANTRHFFGAGGPDRTYVASTNPSAGVARAKHTEYDSLVEQHASANGIPASLVHRVIMRESGYNPRAVSAGNYGIMQIRLGTARAMGYGGTAEGLLDPATNMTYAVKYLAGAYRRAGGNEDRAVALYASGY